MPPCPYFLILNSSFLLSSCWLIFAVVWLLAAISTKRTVYRETSARRLRYMVPMILGWVLMVHGYRLMFPFSVRVIPQTDVIGMICAILCVAGLAFCLWARLTLGRNWSGIVTLKENHELVVRGPYALVRHPIYTGLLGMFAATALTYGHLAGIIAIFIVFFSFWIKLNDEEKLMLKQFPDQYPAYQQRVKRIIPLIF